MAELIWEGKYDKDGRRVVPPSSTKKLTLPDESDSKYPLSDLAELETQFRDLSITIIPRP